MLVDHELNNAIVYLAGLKFPQGFDVAENAPDTLAKLCALLDSGKRMVVYSGGSEATIFGNPVVNYAFRAWHDWHHWQGKLAFDPEGEREACARQIEELREHYGHNPLTDRWAELLDCEINGQVAYAQAHNGDFPQDQLAFATSYLEDASKAIRRTF